MKIRFLPFMIYASVFALIIRIETMIEYRKEFISLIKINDLNANQEEANNEGGEGEASKHTEKEVKDDNVTSTKPEEFNCNNKNNFSETDLILLQNLSKRREELDKRNNEIDTKEALIKAAEIKLDNKLNELKNLKSEINELLVQYDKKEDMKINSLVKIYENMKPQEAAKIFNGLEMPLLLEVIDKMKEAKAAPIMAKMDPGKATTITEKYAEQKKIVPRKVPE